MTDITELAQRTDLLMDNALETAKQLRELSESSVAEAIFESIVENENGKEIQFERPISDLAYAAFLQLERLVEALEKAQQRIAELESEVKFPGVMRCNTCGFTRSHVIVAPGGMRAGESTPEHCPNGCGPLWHDTYRRQYNELYDVYKELESRTVTIEPFRSFVTDADLAALHRFAECCDDPESGGHDLEKEQVRRLEAIGALQRSGRISYITGFGDFLISITAAIKWESA
ncbi:hypothetical protein Q2T70_20225 [Klebsiella oxytoca]|uniref:hypothetical protein n=1 Tax=Klebsiella oxytoca TaxID=571 RepID=UPI00265D719F|nr:hypothetical protein [Klebsiella oxytoca]WKM70699.1 hypothetical protein Q2T70_20225 [Klebsiella oxytoca]